MRLAVLIASALVLAACGGSGGGDADPAPAGAEVDGAVALEGKTLEGERLSLVELRGRPVFVNVWASW